MLQKINKISGITAAVIWSAVFVFVLITDVYQTAVVFVRAGMLYTVVAALPLWFISQYRKETFPPPVTSTVLSYIFSTGLSVMSVLFATGPFFGGPGFWIAAGFWIFAVVFITSLKPSMKQLLFILVAALFYLLSILIINLQKGTL